MSEHPEWDGRGVIIAVLDTGVDPAAIGLQTTSDGRPKVIDIVDATGSGDVAMSASTHATAGESDTVRLQGRTGRMLSLNPEWKNPSGEWRLGVKPVVELYAGQLKGRVTAQEREDAAASSKALVMEADAHLAAWRAATGETAAEPKGVNDVSRRRELEELLAAQAAAKAAAAVLGKAKSETDVIDVVAWNDGSTWRAAIDSSRTGDMVAAPGLASFKQERQYATLDRTSQLSYCLNVYDDGAIVSIVCDAGSHGSHVSGIAAGHHPGSPERNGVAPGAQIVVVKIGDSRLGSMETMQGLMRGVRAVVSNKCDLINLSYGEPTAWPSSSRLIEQIQNAVGTRGVMFITSAGNAGPALSTVGAPAACSSACVAIGASVSSSMAKAGYGARRGPDMTLYSWSSRGPVMDGGLGVSVCAPGGALASVPVWNLSKAMHMNGTSMASPNACGCVALVLSAAKACGVAYTPHSIRRCLENAASHVEGLSIWGLGRGLLNVRRTWEMVLRGAERADAELQAQVEAARRHSGDEAGSSSSSSSAVADLKGGASVRGAGAAAAAGAAATGGWLGIDPAAPGGRRASDLPLWASGVVGASRFRFRSPADADQPVACTPVKGSLGDARGEDWSFPDIAVSVPNEGAGSGSSADVGVYWRDPAQSKAASTVNVSLRAVWHPSVHERVRLYFERRYALVSTADWVTSAGHITFSSRGASFQARVDPTALPFGVHYAEIRGYRVLPHGASVADATSSGPDFFIPITVVRPEIVTAGPAGSPPTYTFKPLPAGSSTHVSSNSPAAAAAAAGRVAASGAQEATPMAGAGSANIALRPAEVARRFVAVPQGATWAEMVIRRVDIGNDDDSAATLSAGGLAAAAAAVAKPAVAAQSWYGAGGLSPEAQLSLAAPGPDGSSADADCAEAPDQTDDGAVREASSRIVLMHCMQVVPHTSEKKTVKEVYARLRPGEEAVMRFPVVAGRTMEAVVGQYWVSLGSTLLTAQVTFRGVQLPRSVAASPCNGSIRVDVTSATHDLTITPTATLKTVRTACAPLETSVAPLGERDYDEQGSRLYRILLRYAYTTGAKPEAVTPWIGSVHGLLYESPHMCQGVYVLDTTPALSGGASASKALQEAVPASTKAAGRMVGFSDAFGESIKLESGRTYSIVAQVVGPDRTALEALATLPLTVSRALPSPVKLVARSTEHVAHAPGVGPTFGSAKLRRGATSSVFFQLPASKDLPAGLPAGAQLVGTVDMADYSKGSAIGDGRSPSGEAELVYTLTAGTVTAPAAAASSAPAAATPAAADLDEEVHRAVRDASVAALASLKGEAFDVLYETLASESPRHLPLLLALLAHRTADIKPLQGSTAEAISAMEDVVEDVVELVDADEIAEVLGRRVDEGAEDATEAKEARKAVEERKSALLKALWARCQGHMTKVCAIASGPGSILHSEGNSDSFVSALGQLRRFEDVSKGAYRLAKVEEALLRKQTAVALWIVTSLLSGSAADAATVAPPAELRRMRVALAKRLAEEVRDRGSPDASLSWELVAERFEAEDRALRAVTELVF